MAMLPEKKPEGLIDGCFGPSAYCESCKYKKEHDYIDKYLCRDCDDKAKILKEAGVTEDIMDKGIKILRDREEKDVKKREI